MMHFSRKTRRVSPRRVAARPRMEPLETRQLLSGFGPEDGAYIVEPIAGHYSDVKIQPRDQKIVATGVLPIVAPTPPGSPLFGVARYDSSGNPDLTYGTEGLATPTVGPLQYSYALTLQPDGKAVVAGTVTMNGKVWGRIAAARLNVDGSADASFGTGGWTGFDVRSGWDEAYAVGLQSSGKIVVAGYSQNDPPTSGSLGLVAQFIAAGAIDAGTGGFGQLAGGGKNAKPVGYIASSFGGPYQKFIDLVVQPDDKIVAAGFVEYSDGRQAAVVARYTAAGLLDTTFNSRGATKGYFVLAPAGLNMVAQGVALQADGKIVITGYSTGIDGMGDLLVARFNVSGTLDSSFGGGAGFVRLDVEGTASVTGERGNDVAIQPDGKIVTVGTVSPQVVDVTGGSVLVARFNADGTPDASFGANGIKLGTAPSGTGWHRWDGRSVALMADGSIIVAGADYWANNGDAHHPLLMRFFPTSSSSLHAAGGAAPTSAVAGPRAPGPDRQPRTEAVGGRQAGGVTFPGLGSLDARSTHSPDAMLDITSGNTISLDSHPADWLWSVIRSPRRRRMPQAGRIDLLSALTRVL